jgi:hypothetical protein
VWFKSRILTDDGLVKHNTMNVKGHDAIGITPDVGIGIELWLLEAQAR